MQGYKVQKYIYQKMDPGFKIKLVYKLPEKCIINIWYDQNTKIPLLVRSATQERKRETIPVQYLSSFHCSFHSLK